MKYEYVVNHKAEPCSRFYSDVPLPQIQVGNVLQVQSAGHTAQIGEHPKIERIEVFVIASEANDSVRSCQISLFLDA